MRYHGSTTSCSAIPSARFVKSTAWAVVKHVNIGSARTTASSAAISALVAFQKLSWRTVWLVPRPGHCTSRKRRMDALKRLYLTFTGDISSFRRLCDRMEATQNIVLSCDGGSASATGVIQIDDSILQRLHGAVEGLEIGHFITLDTGFQTRYGNCCLSDFSLHTCLPGCVGSGHWPRAIVVATPSNFNVELLSGVAVLDVLSVLNPHPRDSSLQFREVDHSYTWNGCKVSLSVTGLIHSLVQQFNPVQALRAMRGGRNWPRAEYLVPNAVELLRGSLVHQGPPETELRRVLNSLPVDVEASSLSPTSGTDLDPSRI